MLKKFTKKIATAMISSTMMLSGFAVSPLFSTSIYAQWPDEGYNHIPAEDKIFDTSDKALDYCTKNAYDIYKKYNCKIEYEVRYDGPGKYTAVFYGYQYGGSSSTQSENTKSLSKDVKFTATVTVDGLNVRKWGGTEYELCSFSPLNTGDQVDVCDMISDKNGDAWLYICYKGLYGFVSAKYVSQNESKSSTNESDEVMAAFRIRCTVDSLNVRDDAGTNANKLKWGPLTYNMLANVEGIKPDANGVEWYHIEYNGFEGWVTSEYVEAVAQDYAKDVKPSKEETSYMGEKQIINEETRFFYDNNSAMNYAYSAPLSSKYNTIIYFYVAYVSENCFAVHFYK